MRWLLPLLVMIWGWVLAPVAWASGPADGLLKLVPADVSLTLTIEDLRGQTSEIRESPLFQGLRKLDAVRAWFASDRFRSFEKAGRDVEAALGVRLSSLRDDLIGDAVVLAYKAGPEGHPDQARGLFLVRPRNRSLIESLLKTINEAQVKSGELASVEGKTRGEVKYNVRTFKAAGRPTEYYVLLEDGSFAWSNAEEMIFGVITCKTTNAPGLSDDPFFAKVRRGLPDRAVVSLFVHPRFLQAAMANAPRSGEPIPVRLAAILDRYLGAIGYAGVALQWRDGFVLHSHETIVPDKLDPWLKRWLSHATSAAPRPILISESTLALISIQIDFEAARDAILDLIPEDDRPALENFRIGLQGILLGQNPNTVILPRLVSPVLLYFDMVTDRGPAVPVSATGVFHWSDPPGADDLALSLDNALRTALALFALAPERRAAHLRIEDRVLGDARLTVLTNGIRSFLAYRTDRNRLVLGNSSEAVARFGTGRSLSPLLAVRAKYFPDVETFAIVDVARLTREVRNLRGPIANGLASRSKRPVDAANRDLGQLIALADLFRAAIFTSTASRDGSEIHRTLGLIAR